jgi:hypothetical protein
MIIDDDDDDDVDPRTLAAAAARLAKYTSEAEVGEWARAVCVFGGGGQQTGVTVAGCD